MKYKTAVLAALLSINAYSNPVFAGSTMVEPVYTKSAQIYDNFVFDAYIETYKGRLFEEIKEVDATELRIDLSFPILSKGQLRLSLPFYTDGDGKRIENNQKTDLDGNGGTFNFASVTYEHQFMDSASDNMDLMAYAGLGYRTERIKTSHGDFMNHRGKNFKAGVRINSDINPSMLFLTDIGVQYYWDSDDLNPAQNGDNFTNAVASAAIIKSDGNLKPALELTYRGDFSDYNNLALVPELIYSFSSADLKLAVPVGITSDADDYGVTLGFSYRM